MSKQYFTLEDKLRVTIRDILPGNYYNVSTAGRANYFYSVPAGNPLRKFYPGESTIMAIPNGNLDKKYLEGDPIIPIYYKKIIGSITVVIRNTDLRRYDLSGNVLNYFRYIRVFKFSPPSTWTEVTDSSGWYAFDGSGDELYIGSLFKYQEFWADDTGGSVYSGLTYYYWDGDSWEVNSSPTYDFCGSGSGDLGSLYDSQEKKYIDPVQDASYYWTRVVCGSVTPNPTYGQINILEWAEEVYPQTPILEAKHDTKKLFLVNNNILKRIAENFQQEQRLPVSEPTDLVFWAKSNTIEDTYYYVTCNSTTKELKFYEMSGETGNSTLIDTYTTALTGLEAKGFTCAGNYLFCSYTEGSGGSTTYYETIKTFGSKPTWPDGWEELGDFIYSGTSVSVSYWQAEQTYSDNYRVRPTAGNGTGFNYINIAGEGAVSGALEPEWPETLGQTVNDGTVIWETVEPLYTYSSSRTAERWSFDGSEKQITNPEWDYEHSGFYESWEESNNTENYGMHQHNCISELSLWLHMKGESEWSPFWSWQMVFVNEDDGFLSMEDPKYHYIAMSELIRNWYYETYEMSAGDELKILHVDTISPGARVDKMIRVNLETGIIDMNFLLADEVLYLKSNYQGTRLWGYDYQTDSFKIWDVESMSPLGTYQYDGQDEADFSDYCIDSSGNIWIGYIESQYGGDNYYIIGYYGLGHDKEGQEIRSWEVPEWVENICIF